MLRMWSIDPLKAIKQGRPILRWYSVNPSQISATFTASSTPHRHIYINKELSRILETNEEFVIASDGYPWDASVIIDWWRQRKLIHCRFSFAVNYLSISYNFVNLVNCLIIGIIYSTVFLTQKKPFTPLGEYAERFFTEDDVTVSNFLSFAWSDWVVFNFQLFGFLCNSVGHQE